MKRFVIIGLGTFGRVAAERLAAMGQDVVAVDLVEELVDDAGTFVTRALVGDGTNKKVLHELGVAGADAAIVSTGDDFGASMLALLALRDLEVKETYVKVHAEEQARIVDALGATEAVFPEKEAALGLASRIVSGRLLRYVQLGDEFSLQEMAVPDQWSGKTLRELALPQTHAVQVVAIHDMLRDSLAIPDPDKPLTPSDTLLVGGGPRQLDAINRLR